MLNELLWKCEYWVSLLKFAMGNKFICTINMGKEGIIMYFVWIENVFTEGRRET